MEALRKKKEKKKERWPRFSSQHKPPSSDGFGLGRLRWLFVSGRTGHRADFWLNPPHCDERRGRNRSLIFFFFFLLQRLFPSAKHFLLRFEKSSCCLPELLQLSRKRKNNNVEKKNTRSLRFFIWRTPVTESSNSWRRGRRRRIRSTKSESQRTRFSFFKVALPLILINISTEERETKLQTRSGV